MPSDPAAELLLQVVQSDGDAARIEHAVRAGEFDGVDWAEVLALARRHRLTSQLYQSLSGVRESVPEDVCRELRESHQRNGMKNLRFAQRVHELCTLFRENDVRALPCKGPVLTEFAYDELGSRWFDDIDFLVAKEDVARARAVLLERGYKQTNYADVPAEILIGGTVFRWGKEFRFRNGDDGVPTELRFEFIGGERSDSEIFDDLWARRVPLTVAGRDIDVLSPADRALLLLVHGTKHGWRRLSWVYDILRLLDRDIDWETVLARARQYGWRDAVLFGLAVTAELTEIDLPPAVRHELDEYYRHEWGASGVTLLMRRNLAEGLTSLEPIATIVFLNDSVSGSLSELVNVLASPQKKDHEWITLPPKLYPLYYLIRPCRIGREYVRRLQK